MDIVQFMDMAVAQSCLMTWSVWVMKLTYLNVDVRQVHMTVHMMKMLLLYAVVRNG